MKAPVRCPRSWLDATHGAAVGIVEQARGGIWGELRWERRV